MAHLVYATGLELVRSYRRLRRPLLRPFPDFLKRKAADFLGYVSPLKLFLTVIAVWSCPDHFFKNFRRIMNGNSPLLSDPWELLTSASALVIAIIAIASFQSIQVNKTNLAEAIALIAFSMPVWAIPVSFVAVRLRSADGDNSDPSFRYYSRSKQLELLLQRWDRSHLPKPLFEPELLSKSVSKRIFRVNTYLALGWAQAICGYFYITISIVVTLILYLVLLEVLGLFLAVVSTGIPILSLIAGIIGLSLIGPCITALFSGVNSVFVQPYYHLLSNAVVHPDRRQIHADFAPLLRLIAARRERFGYYDEDAGEVFIPIDSPFLKKLAQMWGTRRSDFLEHEEAALKKGPRARTSFLIERQKQARKLAQLAYAMRMSWERWLHDAPLVYFDLQTMLDEKGIAQKKTPQR